MPLSSLQRITILMMRGYGDKERSYQQVANLFNETYPDEPLVYKSTVKKTFDRFVISGSVQDLPRSGCPKIATNDDKALEVLLSVAENPMQAQNGLLKPMRLVQHQ